MDTERPADLKSEYYYRALRTTREQTVGDPKTEQKAELLERIIKEFHTQAARNLTRWESNDNPGVSETVTRISTLDIVRIIGINGVNSERMQTDPRVISEQVLLSATPNSIFLTDGSYAAIDLGIDNAIRAIPHVVATLKATNRIVEDTVIVVTGNPTSPGGTLTPEWVEKTEKQGTYTTFAQLHAEQVRSELQDPRVSVTLIGHSYGGTAALLTARQLDNQADRVKVLADSPVLSHGGESEVSKKNAKKKGLKIVAGAAKAALREVWNRREDFAAKLWIGRAYKEQLIRNGVNIDQSLEQKQLRKRVLNQVRRDLITGPITTTTQTDLFPNNIKTYIRLGAYDETIPDTQREAKFQQLQATHIGLVPPVLEHPAPNVRVYGLDVRHAIDRTRVKHWIRAVNALD